MSSSAWKKSNHHYHLVSGWAAVGEFSRVEKIGVILAIFHFRKFILFICFCWYFGVCVQIWQSLKRDLGEEQGGAVPVIMSRGPITPLMRVK